MITLPGTPVTASASLRPWSTPVMASERVMPRGMQGRRKPDLGIHDTVGGKVDDCLERHPAHRLRILHDPEGMGKCVQVGLKGRRSRLVEPPLECAEESAGRPG